MGYMRHHAIVVTSWKAELLDLAHKKARALCVNSVSPIIQGVANGYSSFLVAPDGSKEGWDESNMGDAGRAALLTWIRGQAFEDGSNALDYVEVQFGDDGREAKITASVDDDRKDGAK